MARSNNSYGWHYPGGGWGDSNGPRNDPDYFKKKQESIKSTQSEAQKEVDLKDSAKAEGFSPTPQDGQ